MHKTPLEDWRCYLRASGKPETTVRLRTYQLRRLIEVYPAPLKATPAQLVSWLANPAWSPSSKKSYRSALRSFYSWAVLDGRLAADPSCLLPPIRVSPRPARPAPESAVRLALFRAAPREWIMVALAARHGLRRGEIAHVHSEDLTEDLVGWSLRVHGKGAKDRVLPLSDDVVDALCSLPDGWAFPSPYGGHLTEQHVGKLIAATLPSGWTAHTLRHRFATVAYAGTRDLLAVQEMLGHSKPETTRGYVQLPQDALRATLTAAA